MRPVTIVAPPNYAYHTNASLQNNVPAFAAGSAMTIVYGQAGAFVRTVDWVQRELLDKAVVPFGAFPVPSTAVNRSRARNLMRHRLETIYRTSRAEMVAMIGDFCSFCELPLAGHLLATEHVAPKSIYPTYTVWWWNFLLACRDCNSIKGDVPDRATTTALAGVVGPTERQLRAEIISHYYWPDDDTSTYRDIGRQYWYDTQTAAPVQLTAAEFSRLNRLVASTATRVQANINTAGGMVNNTRAEVLIVNNIGNTTGTRTVALTGLGLQETARSMLRTRQWLFVCLQYDGIINTVAAVPLANKPAVFLALWNMMLPMAVMGGFYSVWVDVLEERGFPVGVVGGFGNAGDRFVNDTQAANAPNPFAVFPGTDVAQVP